MDSITLVTTESSAPEPAFFVTGFGELNQPRAVVPVTAIDPAMGRECWITEEQGNYDIHRSLHYYQTPEWLMGCFQLPAINQPDLSDIIQECYQSWFTEAARRGYPHLLRTWTCMPAITGPDDTSNNYQRFCEGRFHAYGGITETAGYPAATVIGSQQDGIYQTFLAHRNRGITIENPRQTSAFDYPVELQSQAPLFSRALLHQNEYHQYLFISGTASIVEHQTRHQNDVSSQLREALANVRTLIDLAVQKYSFSIASLAGFNQLKVFIKHRKDYAIVRSLLESEIGISVPVIYLEADMCRSDLLVEIEATCLSHAGTP